jgi:hypothetical protein
VNAVIFLNLFNFVYRLLHELVKYDNRYLEKISILCFTTCLVDQLFSDRILRFSSVRSKFNKLLNKHIYISSYISMHTLQPDGEMTFLKPFIFNRGGGGDLKYVNSSACPN